MAVSSGCSGSASYAPRCQLPLNIPSEGVRDRLCRDFPECLRVSSKL